MRSLIAPFRLWKHAMAVSCWLLAAGVPWQVSAGTGSMVTLPLPGAKIKTGLSLEIDAEWLDGNGYRPVRIRVLPLNRGLATADRRLRVRLKPKNWQWGHTAASASTWIELTEGAAFGEQILPIPQSEGWGSLDVETYEDGEKCEDLSIKNLGVAMSGYYGWSEAAPSILIIDADALEGHSARFPATGKKQPQPERLPDIRALAPLFLIDRYGGMAYDANDFDVSEDFDDNDVLRVLTNLPRMELRPLSRLPTNWIEYTAADMILISLTDLRQLAQQEAWPAIRAWLATGPTLCVYGVGKDFERLAELEQLLELARPPKADDLAPLERGWTAPRKEDYTGEVSAVRNAQWTYQPYYQPLVNAQRRNRPAVAANLQPPEPRPFLMRAVEHGRVVAIASENPFPGTREDWCWLFNSLSSRDWMWYQRHGLSLNRDNPDYWNLLIPGVGDAPVNSFLVLISLFVIVIGPVNYFMLHRRRRLYLLLVTVPLGAGLITLALFLYAVINDGLGVRVRPRSLTTLDQAAARSVTWSRQSYYAGLAPSAGMSFPRDAAVYPIDHRPRGNSGRPRDFGRQVDWYHEQQLSRGYLNSRSTSQVLVIESRPSAARLEIEEATSTTDTPRVTNRLGVEIEQLLLCDSLGRFLGGNRLPPGKTIQLHELDTTGLADRWGKLFAEHRPQLPVGLDPNQMENAAAIFGSSGRWWQDPDQGLPGPAMATSMLERGLSFASSPRPTELQPRRYIAIVKDSPEMSLGVKAVVQEAGFHVVMGSW